MPTATHAHDGKYQGHKVNIPAYSMYGFGSLIDDHLCRHQISDPRTSRPFCDATASMITISRKPTIIKGRVLTTTPIPNHPGLLSREAAIVENLDPTLVAPRYMSPESMATRM